MQRERNRGLTITSLTRRKRSGCSIRTTFSVCRSRSAQFQNEAPCRRTAHGSPLHQQEMDGTAGYWSVSDRHKSNPCGAAIIPDTRSIGRLLGGSTTTKISRSLLQRALKSMPITVLVYLRQSRTAASLHRTSDRQWDASFRISNLESSLSWSML